MSNHITIQLRPRDIRSLLEDDASVHAMNVLQNALDAYEAARAVEDDPPDTIRPEPHFHPARRTAQRLVEVAREVLGLVEEHEFLSATQKLQEVPELLEDITRAAPVVAHGRPDFVDRDELLDLASEAISTGTEYGDPAEFFGRVARLWGALIGANLAAEQVAQCMILYKLARLATSPAHVDTWVDIAGYAAIGAETATGAG